MQEIPGTTGAAQFPLGQVSELGRCVMEGGAGESWRVM